MRFLIITHVLHKHKNNLWFAYTPYIREMNLWLKYVDEVEIVAPIVKNNPTVIETAYNHSKITFTKIPSIAFVTLGKSMLSVVSIPFILLKLIQACNRADHIHLRCPGNIGLLGCFVQIWFPKKFKTAKYAGNWDPKSRQPLSYKVQKNILSNTFLTKRITAIVYGEWKNQSENIKPFFTATFKKQDRIEPIARDYFNALKFVFIGSLVDGKQPLFAIKIIEKLYKANYNVSLDVYGDGVLLNELKLYVQNNALATIVKLHGNQDKETIKQCLITSHFSILASKSEGWPKALAEAMFFGVIPIATPISCVPNMLDYGKRGILIVNELDEAVVKIISYLQQPSALKEMSNLALKWSQHFTIEKFDEEIKKLIKP